MGVTSTNALELGIDIGGLDAAIIIGFPGTVASTWQQAGRAGRGEDPALVFLIAYNEPIDQFIMRHPGVRPRPLAGERRHRPGEPLHPGRPPGLRRRGAAAPRGGQRATSARGTHGRRGRRSRRTGAAKVGGAYYWAQPHQPAPPVEPAHDLGRHVHDPSRPRRQPGHRPGGRDQRAGAGVSGGGLPPRGADLLRRAAGPGEQSRLRPPGGHGLLHAGDPGIAAPHPGRGAAQGLGAAAPSTTAR